jgi:hypothetical protein
MGINTNPNHAMAYDDGEIRQPCSIRFSTPILGGELGTSSQTKEVCVVDPSMRLRIQHYLKWRPAPCIGWTLASCRAVRSTAAASTGRDRLIARCTGCSGG